MAPRAGFEPATNRLTVDCSTAELPRNSPLGQTRRPLCRRSHNFARGICIFRPSGPVPLFRRSNHELFHRDAFVEALVGIEQRSEEHTSELQSLMRISYAVFCLKKKNTLINTNTTTHHLHIQ